jgi:hypothetical protein
MIPTSLAYGSGKTVVGFPRSGTPYVSLFTNVNGLFFGGEGYFMTRLIASDYIASNCMTNDLENIKQEAVVADPKLCSLFLTVWWVRELHSTKGREEKCT